MVISPQNPPETVPATKLDKKIYYVFFAFNAVQSDIFYLIFSASTQYIALKIRSLYKVVTIALKIFVPNLNPCICFLSLRLY